VDVKRNRRLRRLVPDAELVRRRAAGETLRALAADYGVAHTTLGRYFARAEAARQLREANQGLRAERRAAATRRAAERRAEQAIRRQAKEQAALARARTRAAAAAASPPQPRRSDYAAWLDQQDTRLPLLRGDLRSRNDELAERAVEAGSGIEAVIKATGLRTHENALRALDPAILVRAFDNAATKAPAPPDGARLRRLVPDPELLRRRAAGETLRRLARDYGVTHTTLGRWLARPEVAKQLHELRRRPSTLAPGKAPP
jgi:lambda repressor-like predicted transcriptional regulator